MVVATDLEAFCRWLRAQGAAEPSIPAFRTGAERLLARAGGSPIVQRHVDEALAAQTAAGTPPADVRNLQRIGAALLRFQQETPLAAQAPAGFKVVDAALARGPTSFAAHPALQPRRLVMVLVGFLVVAAVGFWVLRRGVRGRRDAVIESMTAYHRPSQRGRFLITTTFSPVVEVRLIFHSYPKQGRRNVRLGFSSKTLERDQMFDWAYIARYSSLRADSERDPPLGVPIEMTVPLLLLKDVEALRTDLLLTGTLEWGGLRQDTRKQSLGPFFERKE